MNYKNNQLLVKNLIVKNCVFHCPKYELASKDNPSAIRIAGVEGENIRISNIKVFSNEEMKSYFINILDMNNISNINITDCKFEGDNAFDYFHFSDVVPNNSKLTNVKIEGKKLIKQ